MGVAETFQYARGGGMNVGILAMGWTPDVGGIPSHTADLSRALIERGHQVYVLCLDTSGEGEPFTTSDSVVDGANVRRVAYAYGDHAKLFDLMVHKGLDDVVLGWMAETPCDLIHVHHLTGFGGGALRAIDDVGQPLVMTLHDYWMLDPRGQLFRPDGTRRDPASAEQLAEDLRNTWPHLLPSGGAEATDHLGRTYGSDEELCRAYLDEALALLALPKRLFAPSRATAEVFERAGVPAGRIAVVENGVDAATLAAETARLRAERPADAPLTLGLLGTCLPSKGTLELAQAFVEADVAELHLRIAGNAVPYHGDTTTLDGLEALAADHPRIQLTGEYPQSELPAILAGLDGVAAPSRWDEVFGLTVREARAAGLPVLVSDIGALPPVTDGGQAGLVVPHDDRAAWIEALRRFAADTDARAAWAAHPAPVHTSMDMAVELERLYADVVEQATGIRPDVPSEAEADQASTAAERPTAQAPSEEPKRGFLSRLFGRG